MTAFGRSRAAAVTCAIVTALSCGTPEAQPRTFTTPEAAVRMLIDVVNAGDMEELISMFGADGKELAASSDPATARHNREVFSVAVAEGWQLTEHGPDKRSLVIGHERWQFPVPLMKDVKGWRFDTAAGKEEIIARRIGRNELSVIQICRTYVVAQRIYARSRHDGKPAGLYAKTIRSHPARHDGLYWPVRRGETRSPLGDLMSEAAVEERTNATAEVPSPFHGYYFRILTGQGANAPGGVKEYVIGGEMSAGFALIAWPAEYDVTGVMTFIVNQDGIVHERDLGSQTGGVAKAMPRYDPGPSWQPIR